MADVSRRQFERLFHSYLSTSPSRHYLSCGFLTLGSYWIQLIFGS